MSKRSLTEAANRFMNEEEFENGQRKGRFTFDSKSRKPDWAKTCSLCGDEFVDGDQFDVRATMPNDDENLNKMLDGKPHDTQGVFAHTSCVDKEGVLKSEEDYIEEGVFSKGKSEEELIAKNMIKIINKRRYK